MAKETEAWENDQILDPEKKLAEIESAPPSELEQAPIAVDRVPTTSEQEKAEAPAAAAPTTRYEHTSDPPTKSTETPGPDINRAPDPDTSSPEPTSKPV